MISFEKALETVLNSARVLGTERIGLIAATSRVLAEDVKADLDMPPFDNSAMDGFACRRADLHNELTVIETIPAGCVPQKTIQANECSKIMTGAMLPEGADCVIMKEYVEAVTENSIRFTGDKTTDNIRKKAEDIKSGQVVLEKGCIIKAQHIAVLACMGCAKPSVAKRPNVAVLATGSELVEPSLKPQGSQIRNSNSFQTAAQIEGIGVVAVNYGIVKDTIEKIDGVFKKAVQKNDVIIVSGGVSVGDYDFVPQVFRQNGFNLLFEKIAVKPGKPAVFGVSEDKFCFGLPGNPVSAFVLLEILIKPFLYALMGCTFEPINIRMPLAETLTSKNSERQRWLPVRITADGEVNPLEYHGSAHINSLCQAHGLISMDVGVKKIEKGQNIRVRLIGI